MPGLFGIVDLKSNSISSDEKGVIFTEMADVLRHYEEYRVERARLSGSNLMIGRVGLPWQNPLEWPIRSDDTNSDIHLFVAGRLLESEANQPTDSMPDGTALRHWGGFFSAVLTEPAHGTTLLVVDRRASFPIFYAQTKNYLFFAPEVKALLISLLVKREIDLGAFATFLALGYLHSDQTLFQSVKRLPGGELLRVENGEVMKETYWRFAPGSASDSASQADLEHELGQLLKAVVRKHMGEPEKTVIFLSGGVDSRGILGGALANVHGAGEKLNTVSFGANQGTKNSDVAIAALVARNLNTNHQFFQRKISNYREHFTRVNYLIDGLSDVAAFHSSEYQIMVELRHLGYECALSGLQLFGHSLSAPTKEVALVLASMRRLREVKGLASIIQKTYYDEMCEASDAAVERVVSEVRDLSPDQAQDFFHYRRCLQTWLQSACYYKQIELDLRNPLLDNSILDFMAKVPDPLRVKKLLYRKVFSTEYPHLAQFPYAIRGNVEDWPKLLANESPVREYALEELNDRSSGIWKYLDPVALAKLLKTIGRGAGIQTHLTQSIDPKALVKRSLAIFAPELLAHIRGQRRTRPVAYLGVDKIIMRSLVLKNWYDTFV